jgi:lipopolysaccharide export system permease protein
MELNQRISFGFAPLVFCLLGVALTLIPRASRTNRSWGFMLCLFWLMAYYALLSLGKALGDKSILPPLPALWLPNLVVGAIATQFFRHALQESPLYLPQTLERAATAAAGFVRDLKRRR